MVSGLVGPKRKSLLALMISMALAISLLPFSNASAEDVTPGERPESTSKTLSRMAASSAEPGGLGVVVNERGRVSSSVAAVAADGESSVVVTKPAGAEIRGAYLATATTGFTNWQLSSPILLNGQPVPYGDGIQTGINSYNYFADVTELVKAKIDGSAAGDVPIPYAEPDPTFTDGSVLEIIYDDPAVTADQSVTIMYGALRPTGDTYTVNLAEPISLTDRNMRLEMSLGISYSYQSGGTQQFSTVDVNGTRLTSAAGGEDDGLPKNGGLITVGGRGDSPANPVDASAGPTGPRSDDELYDLTPFVNDGDRQITVKTNNPSLDDNVFLATFTMNPPVTTVETNDADFVQVALGDSYQSGEGAAMALRPSSTYLADGFENGSNYPEMVGDQENT